MGCLDCNSSICHGCDAGACKMIQGQMPLRYVNIEIQRGTDFTFKLKLKDIYTGLPLDLTGYKARFTVRYCSDLPAPIDLYSYNPEFPLAVPPLAPPLKKPRPNPCHKCSS